MENFNTKDHGQANYPLWIEFPSLPNDIHPYVDLLACQFGKVLVANDRRNSFGASPSVCVEVAMKQKLPVFISVFTTDKIKQKKVHYLNLWNAYFACQT